MLATGSLFEHFNSISDPRVNRGKNYSLYEMIVAALTAAICGANGWADVERFGRAKIKWFKKFLTLQHGIASHDTFGRVIALLDTDEFLSALQNWIQTLQLDMKDLGSQKIRRHVTVEKSHGRQERREYYVAPSPKDLQGQWKDIATVGMVYRYRKDVLSGKVHEEMMYFISSLPPKVRTLAKFKRDHWMVENTLHWSLDVNFGEDDSRICKGNGAQIASIFCRLALMILQQDTIQKENICGKQLTARWSTNVLEQILNGLKAI